MIAGGPGAMPSVVRAPPPRGLCGPFDPRAAVGLGVEPVGGVRESTGVSRQPAPVVCLGCLDAGGQVSLQCGVRVGEWPRIWCVPACVGRRRRAGGVLACGAPLLGGADGFPEPFDLAQFRGE